MTGTLQRRFLVFAAAACAGFAGWFWLPGTPTDRAAFSATIRGFANPPFFISGNGSHAEPWKLRTLTARVRADTSQAPIVVSLGDDVEGFFQSSPPSPIDLAVILSNFQRLGANKAAVATTLAWESPDPIALIALERSLRKFDSVVTTAPLSRGSIPDLMPPAFRQSSLPLSAVHGDTSSLPVVNRIPLPGVILGGENALAGFQILESEKTTRPPSLLARWEDRVVFAFPLLTVLQRFDFPLDGMEIKPGSYIKLSPKGPFVPIDAYGRMTIEPKFVSPYIEHPAELLIDGGDDLFPDDAPESIILRDSRSAAEAPTRAFSQDLPSTIAAIASDSGIVPETAYPRLPRNYEIVLLAAVAALLAGICLLPPFPRNIGFLLIAGIFLAAQSITTAIAGIWLPGLPLLAATLTASLIASCLPQKASSSRLPIAKHFTGKKRPLPKARRIRKLPAPKLPKNCA